MKRVAFILLLWASFANAQSKSIVFIHHSTGSVLTGSREGYSSEPDYYVHTQIPTVLDSLDTLNGTTTTFRHHDRDSYNALWWYQSDGGGSWTNEIYESAWCANNVGFQSHSGGAGGVTGNSPSRWYGIFCAGHFPTLKNRILGLSGYDDYDVIVLKESFQDHEHIAMTDTLDTWKAYYTEMADTLSHYTNKEFIFIGPHPYRDSTDAPAATRQLVRDWADWQVGTWACMGTNINCFNWFNYLANETNDIKTEYQRASSADNHANGTAGIRVGYEFAIFCYQVAHDLRTNLRHKWPYEVYHD